jgi:hypothetical protein
MLMLMMIEAQPRMLILMLMMIEAQPPRMLILMLMMIEAQPRMLLMMLLLLMMMMMLTWSHCRWNGFGTGLSTSSRFQGAAQHGTKSTTKPGKDDKVQVGMVLLQVRANKLVL